MPCITLPDGSQRFFDKPVTVMEVASDIGPGLAAATIAGEVDGVLCDACVYRGPNRTFNQMRQ